MILTNALAYCDKDLITVVSRFTVHAPDCQECNESVSEKIWCQ
jgi:hypothetical protein